MTDLSGAAGIENDPASKALIAKQQAEFAESQKAGGKEKYPQAIDGSHEGDDSRRIQYDNEADALAAVNAARAAGLYVIADAESGSFIQPYGGGWVVHTEKNDPNPPSNVPR
jgi:hypothetical protein